MHTIITEERDGYEVVTGFGRLSVDPVSTLKKAQMDITRDEYFVKLGALVTEFKGNSENKKLAVEILELQKAVSNTYNKLVKNNPVYFRPKSGEFSIDEDTWVKLRKVIKTMPGSACLLRDGTYVENNTGREYWAENDEKWRKCAVTSLGEKLPQGAYYHDDVPPEIRERILRQLDIEALRSMPSDARDTEYERRKDSIRSRSVMFRQGLEIEGAPDAFQRARDEHTAGIEQLDSIFREVKK